MANNSPSTGKLITGAIAILFSIGAAVFLVFDLSFFVWICWGAIFAILETRAVLDKEQSDTLSEQVWLGTLSKSAKWSFLWKTVVVAFLTWLAHHLIFGS